MDSDGPQQLIILLIMLCLSAFFSAAETSLTSLSKIRLRSMLDEEIKGARSIEKLTTNMKKLLSTILIGNNLINAGMSALTASIAISLVGNSSFALGISTVAVTFLILVFAEITPKTLAAQNTEKVALSLAKPIGFVMWVFTPVNYVMNIVTGFLLSLLGANPNKSAPLITEAELKTIVNVSHEQGVIQVGERQMINNVFDFGDYKAKDVMTPRTDIIAVPYEATFEEVAGVFEEERFSRMPVYKESTDNIVGILHLKDFAFRKEEKEFVMEEYMRPPFFTYESKPTQELFSVMQTKRIPMAVVLDEYGGTSGILTMEDLIEEIVGEISDEYDEDEDEIKVIKEDEYIVDGGTKITDVNDMLGTFIESEDFDSIGGFVIGVLGRIPELGETVESGEVRFVVEGIDKNRIEKLRIYT